MGPLIQTKIGCCAAKFCQEQNLREFHSGVIERPVYLTYRRGYNIALSLEFC